MSTDPSQATPLDLDFDADALREKYRAERDKRVRPDGNDQYLEVTGDFSRYVDDPYVAPGFTRAPLNDEVEVLIVGGGFGGLLMGARLRDAGVQDIRVVEKGGDFGGTWYWNRYPGAQCDVEAYIYLPLLEELGYVPKEKYTRAPEILAHCRAIGEKYDLYRNACFQTQITAMQWDEEAARWIVQTNHHDRMKARHVVMSNGPLNRPKLPGIPGINTFQGHTFHTSRWDYQYTGGDSLGGLTNLRDKRVGIIGTGATAIQCVPYLGEYAQSLHVFQRTPSSVDVRNQRDTDPEWAKTLGPGWQKQRMENFNVLVQGGYQEEDLVRDGWTDMFQNLLKIVPKELLAHASAESLAGAMELADFAKMEQVRARVDAVVHDTATAAALKPWYRQLCKRPCFNDEYLQTFNRPNVTLVDTKGQGVDRLTAQGVVYAGQQYPLDCLIFATGFEVGTGYTRRSGYDIIGRGGVALSDYWASGVRSLHGFVSHGFPNCFFMGLTQNSLTVNFPHMLDEQARHIGYILQESIARQAQVVEPTPEAERAWATAVQHTALHNERFLAECTPGYYNNEGNAAQGHGLFRGLYSNPIECIEVLREWRANGELEGLRMR